MNAYVQINKLATVSVFLLLLITFSSTAQVAHWKLDGNGNDEAAGNHTLTLQGSPSFVSGQFGQAISLDGTSQYAENLVTNLVTDYPLTMAVWVKTSVNTLKQGVCYFASNANAEFAGIELDATGKFTVVTRQGTNQKTITGQVVADGNWHHLAVAFASVTQADIYVDGSYKFTAPGTSIKPFPVAYNRVVVGRYQNGTSAPKYYFNGAIDDVRIFNTALTASEINAIYLNAATAATDYFRTLASGNWSTATSWQSSANGSTGWITATLAPTSAAAQVDIRAGHLITVAASASASTLNVNAGGQLTLDATGTLTATTMNLKSDAANGTATFKDNGGTLSITNPVHVEQYLTVARQWWYISSPVSNATSLVFSPTTGITGNKFGYWNEPTFNYPQITDNVTSLTAGQGYVLKLDGIDGVYTFNGTLNTGDLTVTPAPTRTGTDNGKRGFNLVGNPYPSYLDWMSADMTKTNIRNTIWYRTYTGTVMTFDTFDGTTGTGLGQNGQVTRYIPPMQAFWVKVNADGDVASLVFKNTARSHQTQSVVSNQLRASVQQASEPAIVRLRITNGTNDDETILVADALATDSYDAFDSPKMSNDNKAIPEIFTLADNEQLVINHLNNFDFDKELNLGFRPGIAGNFSIKANQLSNMATDTKVILKENWQTPNLN